MGSIQLVRHGQASFGSKVYDRLSAHGSMQARLFREWLRPRGFAPAYVVAGNLTRQRVTGADY